jgi:hypothetical protein
MLLGEAARRFHRSLSEFASAHPRFHFHYVTARQLVNIVHAAEAGHAGNPSGFRDFRYHSRLRPPASQPNAPAP